MRIKISNIKINPGRREAEPKAVEELARSITAVGLMNPVTLDQNNTLVAGLHRLEAAKLLGWTEIECTTIGMDSVQAKLAEIDENIVRTKLNRQELCEQLLRRKEIYETLHPETRHGMRNGQTAKNANLATLETKSFAEDTAEKTGMSKRAVSRLLQIANNLTGDARRIVEAHNMTQDTALKLSRLQHDEQVEAASMLAAGTMESVEQYQEYQRERRKAIALSRPLSDEPPVDTRTEEEKERQKKESLDGLVREFSRFIEQFLDRMKMYQGYADDFAEMSQPQISQVWDSAAAVDMAIIAFSKEVKALQAENENGGYDNEN
jgi:ParB family chromosome partitioning protein